MKTLDDYELDELKKWAESSTMIQVPDLVLRCIHMARVSLDAPNKEKLATLKRCDRCSRNGVNCE